MLRRPLFEGAVLELAAEATAFRFLMVTRVMRFGGESGLGGEWSSLFVAEEEVWDWDCCGVGASCLAGDVWCFVGDERCSGVTVIAVEVE